MIYEIVERSPFSIAFRTHPRARRGRGVLYATAPGVIYLFALSAMFAAAAKDIAYLALLKTIAAIGLGVVAALSVAGFAIGRRKTDWVRADSQQLEIRRTPIVGRTRSTTLPYRDYAGFAVDLRLRSLGADVLLVALAKDGRRVPIAEGEPHSNQIRDFAREISGLSSLPVETGTN